ncbi:12703_t:CDS:2 [Ambispora gerdemannii]|uniref:12703_t:CDS:1 n=1 Tax=Ambispora gerdemannii TaxID=144530 RepID=A0A9N9CJ35_9GLOM|nr:12703_t:CDS:2 [Ambispora gerdemannii]
MSTNEQIAIEKNYTTFHPSEFNIEDYTDEQEASLEDLFNHFDQFIECLQDTIPIDQFPAEGVEYHVPLNTNFHEWVQEFGKTTGATYSRHNIERI